MTNLDIAQSVRLKPIQEIFDVAGLNHEQAEPTGRYKGKLTYDGMAELQSKPAGKLILVTAMTPTPHGEGKSTVTIGLAQALNRLGKSALPAIREPALGPVFGVKGGACGGGYSQVLPMEDINLFFNGDFPAITSAHNLLSALVDAHVQNGNDLGIDVRQSIWPRTIDMNDRALRDIIIGLGGRPNGVPREDHFVITPASEIMAILCLSRSMADLKSRLAKIMCAVNRNNDPVTAEEIKAVGPMAALLRDALRPNVVQTVEGGAAFVHGGPFANIAHGCSSIVATRCALGLCEYVVTEAGFAADLGAQKFMEIKVPKLGVAPSCVVLVVTVRAIRHHGGGDLLEGIKNVERHLAHLRQYRVPIVVAINRFSGDKEEDLVTLVSEIEGEGSSVVVADPWNSGGQGCEVLASEAIAQSARANDWRPMACEDDNFRTKLDKIVKHAYGADGFDLSPSAERDLRWAERHGFVNMDVCVAKTQSSLTAEPSVLNAPTGFRIPIREVHVSAGAGFLVAIAGDMMLMPGLGKDPNAHRITVDDDGVIAGLV